MRFSILQLMGWTAAIAVVLGCLFGLPDFVSLPLMFWFLMSLPVALIVGTIYASDWRRTFFIGGLIGGSPFILAIFFYVPMYAFALAGGGIESLDEFSEASIFLKIAAVVFGLHCAMNGLLAVGIRWLVQPAATKPAATPPYDPAMARRSPAEAPTVPYAVLEGRMTVETPS